MKYIFPLPPTTNHMYAKSRFGVYKTQDTRIWEKEAMFEINKKHKAKTIESSVYVGIEYFLKRDRDLDNGKLLCDALQDNGVIKNDSQIIHMNIKKYKDIKNPRVEITVEEI